MDLERLCVAIHADLFSIIVQHMAGSDWEIGETIVAKTHDERLGLVPFKNNFMNY